MAKGSKGMAKGSKGKGSKGSRFGRPNSKPQHENTREHDNDERRCLCCGKPGHEKIDCRMKDIGCSICGRVGHVKATCRQGDSDNHAVAVFTSAGAKGNGKGSKGSKGSKAGNLKGSDRAAPYKASGNGKSQPANIVCDCCGKVGHKRPECHMKDKECGICGRVGHLKSMCRSGERRTEGAKGAGRKGGEAAQRGAQDGGREAGRADIVCNCCGKVGHKSPDCSMKDKECGICGRVGHLKSVCRQGGKASKGPAHSDEVCKCCGKRGHTRADCRQKDKTCNICGKVGHISPMCRQSEGAAVPKKGKLGIINDKFEKKKGKGAKGAGKSSKGKGSSEGGWVWVPDGSDASVCKCCGKTGHSKSECKQKDKTCSLCGKVGHVMSACKQNKGGGVGKSVIKDKLKGKLGKTAKKLAKNVVPKGIRCFNCGERGHRNTECDRPKLCKICKSEDHEGQECPLKDDPCAACGKKGHVEEFCFKKQREESKDGPTKDGPAKDAAKKDTSKRMKCFNCGERGHRNTECDRPKLCKICKSEDHAVKECPLKDEPCATCGKKGHTEDFCFKKPREESLSEMFQRDVSEDED